MIFPSQVVFYYSKYTQNDIMHKLNKELSVGRPNFGSLQDCGPEEHLFTTLLSGRFEGTIYDYEFSQEINSMAPVMLTPEDSLFDTSGQKLSLET